MVEHRRRGYRCPPARAWRRLCSRRVPDADVYATARGPLARLAAPLAGRARARRHRAFFPALATGARVLDLGCGALGLRALEPSLDITGVDIAPQGAYPGPFVQGDAVEGLPFADGEFDLVYCSSVIEHVSPTRRAAFAAEARRVGRGWMVQTPARSFPIEPHSLLPGAHWVPVGCAVTTGGSAPPASGRRSCCSRGPSSRAVRARAPRACARAREELGVRAGPGRLSRVSRRGGRCRC